jgi:hypothetical protein
VKVCAALRRAIFNLLGVGLDELPDLGDVRVSSITGVRMNTRYESHGSRTRIYLA